MTHTVTAEELFKDSKDSMNVTTSLCSSHENGGNKYIDIIVNVYEVTIKYEVINNNVVVGSYNNIEEAVKRYNCIEL